MVGTLVALALAAAPASIDVQIDAGRRAPISPFVYGMNFPDSPSVWGEHVPRGVTLARFGGNRLSAWNWETNHSNCGNDCGAEFPNDAYLGGGDVPGESARSRAAAAFARGSAFLATVPMLGWVAADAKGPVGLADPLDVRRAKRFVPSRPRKNGPFSATPDLKDGAVYQDEFVAWMDRQFPFSRKDPARRLLWSLDNEPDLWGVTHEAVCGNRKGKDGWLRTGYADLVARSAEYAAAVKAVVPEAVIFGPALSGWNGIVNLYHNDAPDPAGGRFLEYYLDGMRKASEARGTRLLDVLDVHWYPAALSTRNQQVTNEWAEQDEAMIEARVQSPRSLWDARYEERSWVARTGGGPVRILARLRHAIDDHFPGTQIAITEYWYGRGGDVSGAIAQADVLGIYGREGVYAAALWPNGSRWAYGGDVDRTYACTFAAFRAFRDYDGQGGAFGDLSLAVTSSDAVRASVYASGDSRDPDRLVLVAINKTAGPLRAAVSVVRSRPLRRAAIWRITGRVGACEGPARVAPDVPVADGRLAVELPPLSVSTIVLSP